MTGRPKAKQKQNGGDNGGGNSRCFVHWPFRFSRNLQNIQSAQNQTMYSIPPVCVSISTIACDPSSNASTAWKTSSFAYEKCGHGTLAFRKGGEFRKEPTRSSSDNWTITLYRDFLHRIVCAIVVNIYSKEIIFCNTECRNRF